MTRMKPLILLCLAATLSGCATYSREECDSGNWDRIGIKDGEDGRLPDKFKQHAKACKLERSEANQSIYLAGRAKGLASYCTSARGYREGALGQTYLGTCPANLEAEFQKGYKTGKRMQEAESRQSDIADALRAASTPQEMQRLAAEDAKIKQEIQTLRAQGDELVRNSRKKTSKKN